MSLDFRQIKLDELDSNAHQTKHALDLVTNTPLLLLCIAMTYCQSVNGLLTMW